MYDEEDDEKMPDNESAEGEPARRTGSPTRRGGGMQTMSAGAPGGGMAGRWGGGMQPGMMGHHGGGMMGGGGGGGMPDWGAIRQRFQDRFAQRLPPWLQGGGGMPQGLPQGAPPAAPAAPPGAAAAPAMGRPAWLQQQLAAAAQRFAPQQGQEPGGGIIPRGMGRY